MKNNKFSKWLLLTIALLTFNIGQAQNADPLAARIYNASNPQALSEYGRLNLVDTHPDLLDPTLAWADRKNVVASWVDLHNSIGKYLEDNGFSWGVDAESISIYQKIYFYGDGKITNFLFNIRTPAVTEEKKTEFGQLLAKFTRENKLSYILPTQFAQCGKTRYSNNQYWPF